VMVKATATDKRTSKTFSIGHDLVSDSENQHPESDKVSSKYTGCAK